MIVAVKGSNTLDSNTYDLIHNEVQTARILGRATAVDSCYETEHFNEFMMTIAGACRVCYFLKHAINTLLSNFFRCKIYW